MSVVETTVEYGEDNIPTAIRIDLEGSPVVRDTLAAIGSPPLDDEALLAARTTAVYRTLMVAAQKALKLLPPGEGSVSQAITPNKSLN